MGKAEWGGNPVCWWLGLYFCFVYCLDEALCTGSYWWLGGTRSCIQVVCFVVSSHYLICLECRKSWFDPWVRKIPWRRKWQPTPVLLPGESHEGRSLVGYSPWGRRVGHDWVTLLSPSEHWRRKWQPTPVFLPGESQGRGSLVGCRLWSRTESDTTEAT